MTKIVAVVSGKGGVGKTTLVSNLAAAMSMRGKHVIVVDGNVSGPNLAIHLGIPEVPPISLNDVIKNHAYIMQAIYQHPLGFKVIPASMAELEAELGGLKQHLTRLLGVYDLILIDSAPGVNDEVRASIEVADEVLIVTNPEVPAIKNAQMVKELADKLKKPIAGVVVNIVRNEKHELSKDEIERALHARVIGIVKEHSKVREAISYGIPVVAHAPRIHVSREITKIAYHLLEEEPPKESFLDKILSFLTREVVIKVR